MKHVWNYQAFAAWFTDLMHDTGDASCRGHFRRHLARAEFDRLYTSKTANHLFAEFLTGLNRRPPPFRAGGVGWECAIMFGWMFGFSALVIWAKSRPWRSWST
ncbi:hypothetical protein ACFRCG_29070 [Embleya sp. NPDC056575]|uniref:hypothetical protein n=1 Tax=unclassified Embleya TaxID=2699296 RepID=UPI0036B92554